MTDKLTLELPDEVFQPLARAAASRCHAVLSIGSRSADPQLCPGGGTRTGLCAMQ
jgi:hypothetical protein